MSLPAVLSALGRSHLGRVASFDEARGLGVVEDGATQESHPFHCSAVADGSRQIDPGTVVRYVLRAGGGGRLEADELIDLAAAS